jgi:hypothetical protein
MVRAEVSKTYAAFARIENISRCERNELEFAVLFSKEDNILSELIRSRDIEFFEQDHEYGVYMPIVYKQSVEASLKVGRRVLLRTLREACFKVSALPQKGQPRFLVVQNGLVRLPSNLESAADSMVHKLILLYPRLGAKMEVVPENCSTPTFSHGWQTHMSYTLDLVSRLQTTIYRTEGPREKLPTKLTSEFGRVLIKVLVYKWANKRGLSAYLKSEIKEGGNLSESAFVDRVKSWGTPVENNIGSEIVSAIYGIISIFADHPGLQDCLPKSYFMTGVDLRKAAEPPRQVVEKTGKKTQIVQRGEINVLRFDNIRFLMPSERSALKRYNESGDLENQIRRFDELEIKDRDYPKFLEDLKKKVADNSVRYFTIRRLARQRLYAVKEVRREAKQPENVPDSDFASNGFIETVCKQAESIIIDMGRKRSVEDRLKTPIVSFEGSVLIGPPEEC